MICLKCTIFSDTFTEQYYTHTHLLVTTHHTHQVGLPIPPGKSEKQETYQEVSNDRKDQSKTIRPKMVFCFIYGAPRSLFQITSETCIPDAYSTIFLCASKGLMMSSFSSLTAISINSSVVGAMVRCFE